MPRRASKAAATAPVPDTSITTTSSSPWPIPVAVYDEDYRDGSFRLSHVVTRYTAPFHWPNTLTLDSSSRLARSPALMSAPLVILRPFDMRHRYDARWSQSASAPHNLHVSLRHCQRHTPPQQREWKRQRVIATNSDEWEEMGQAEHQWKAAAAAASSDTVVHPHPSVLHHIERETGNAMLHFYSPLVTYVLHRATGRLRIDSVCWVLSDITCMPENINRSTIERMKELRSDSIKKQARDHRIVVDLGERSATFLAESWTPRDSLRADI